MSISRPLVIALITATSVSLGACSSSDGSSNVASSSFDAGRPEGATAVSCGPTSPAVTKLHSGVCSSNVSRIFGSTVNGATQSAERMRVHIGGEGLCGDGSTPGPYVQIDVLPRPGTSSLAGTYPAGDEHVVVTLRRPDAEGCAATDTLGEGEVGVAGDRESGYLLTVRGRWKTSGEELVLDIGPNDRTCFAFDTLYRAGCPIN